MASGSKGPKPLGKRQQAVLSRARSYGAVYFEHKPEVGDRFWWPNGREAPERTIRQLIALGKLVPQGDDLFGASHSQTYRPAA
jgi:hypothetical protein